MNLKTLSIRTSSYYYLSYILHICSISYSIEAVSIILEIKYFIFLDDENFPYFLSFSSLCIQKVVHHKYVLASLFTFLL